MQFAKSVLLILPVLGHAHAEAPAHFDLQKGLSHVEESVHLSNTSLPVPADPVKQLSTESKDSFVSKASSIVLDKAMPYGQDTMNVVTHCCSGNPVHCVKAASQSSVAQDIAKWLDGSLPVKAALGHVQDGAHAVDKCFYTGTSADCIKALSESGFAKYIQKGLSQEVPQASKARVYFTDMADIANKCLPLEDKAQKASLGSLEAKITTQKGKVQGLNKDLEALEGSAEHQDGHMALELENEKLTQLEGELASKQASILSSATKTSPFVQKLGCITAAAKSQMGQDAGQWIGETVPGVKTVHAHIGNVAQFVDMNGQSALKALEVGKNLLVDGSYIRQYCFVDKDGKKCLVAVLMSNTAVGGYKAAAKKLLGIEF